MIKKLLFVFVLASVFVQCEVPVHEEYDLYGDGIDDDDDDEVLNTTFTCSVGGVAFTGINPVAYKHNQFLSINATNSENKKIQINLDTNTIGVYSLDFDNTTDWVTNNKIYSMMYSPDEEQEFWASNAMEDSEGSVQITHYNTSNMTISGIFTAYMQDDESLEDIEIVNGVWNNFFVTFFVTTSTPRFFNALGFVF
jgi:hypothetical protein